MKFYRDFNDFAEDCYVLLNNDLNVGLLDWIDKHFKALSVAYVYHLDAEEALKSVIE